MHEFQKQFIEFSVSKGVLCFGEFTLKSGRVSPYFFNSGLFNDGDSLKLLGHYYKEAIEQAALEFDMLFGPAYKGIPLAAAVAMSYAEEDARSLPFCFDRKESKDHGEGGNTLGAALSGRVLLVDDVITAGTSVRLSRQIIHAAGAQAVGIAIALDRQERGQGDNSAIHEIEQEHGMKVISIVSLDNIIEHLESKADMAASLARISDYKAEYGSV